LLSERAKGEPIWHSLEVNEVFNVLKTQVQGLHTNEVQRKLSVYGRNVLPERKPTSALRILASQFNSFFVIILLFAAALAYSIGFIHGQEPKTLTVEFILFIVGATVLIGFIQEYRSNKALRSIKALLTLKARVVREGMEKVIDAGEIVPGDIVVLSQGQKVPADARLIESSELKVDESVLTGESRQVEKDATQVLAEGTLLADSVNMVYSSTLVVRGRGKAVVVHTGSSTEVGKIAARLGVIKEQPTPFQVEFKKVSKQLTYIIIILVATLGIVMYFYQHLSLVDVLINALSLAVATIPEALSIVLTFSLAMGALKMTNRNALVKKLSTVESLGSVDTICSDKTGTITQNRMTVQSFSFGDQKIVEKEDVKKNDDTLQFRLLLRASVLCNNALIETSVSKVEFSGDPVEIALLMLTKDFGLDIEKERQGHPRLRELPFTPERKRMTTLHKENSGFSIFSKGAPGTILDNCEKAMYDNKVVPLTLDERKQIRNALETMYSSGLYVLAFSYKENFSSEKVETQENGMTFLGLVGMIDPPKPGVKESIGILKQAKIRIIMITGDNATAARAIGREIGLGEAVVVADELRGLSEEKLSNRLRNVDIIARATPDIKDTVLRALQKEGHFVAMTGDGVNDATAMKQANVSVAMGLQGTDVAKEIGSMVLLDDNFSTITATVEEGRRVFDNIRKFSNYLISANMAEIFIIMAISLLGFKLPLTATMVLWINVLTDVLPANALAIDPAVPDIMKRRAKRADEPILNRPVWWLILWSAIRTTVAYTLIFFLGLWLGGEALARTMIFTAIVLHAFTRIMVVRQMDNLSIWSNPYLLLSYALSVGLQVMLLYTPLREVFGVVALPALAWAVLVPIVMISSTIGVYHSRWILRRTPMW